MKNKLRKFALGQEKQNKRLTVEIMKDIEIEIPVLPNGDYDLPKQKEMSIEYGDKEMALDEAMQAKDELIKILKQGLSR